MTAQGQKKMDHLPIINIGHLSDSNRTIVHSEVEKIRLSCSNHGFFYITNYNPKIDTIFGELYNLSQQFFSMPMTEKNKIKMSLGGLAWRGYFSVGEELTSGKPDKKEGIYFGSELAEDHPKVVAKTPMHGKNLFPSIDNFRDTVLIYMAQLEALGQTILEGIALSLDLERNYFKKLFTTDPFVLFRIFHYPSIQVNDGHEWSVGEHTDYGLLTILKQDNISGLQIKSKGKWIDAPPIENSFVCNIGDILDIITKGYYKSTPHRVLNKSGKSRISMPFFMDPNFDAKIKAIDGLKVTEDFNDRWDKNNIYAYNGNYGNYVLQKVAKVFPQLINDAQQGSKTTT